ncbi:Toxoplasma gondii family C protein [Toxoplasma gondii ME49]|nr:Toxoplasma gondii family C protein [Toxoplasma gondii ME49]ESS30470.1 Toxoplasma gondii family C protein [Toxoplasma gondii VEG]KFG35245.1 Toxoplasma gondii family C protein [Toxoplasma gondii GAB2-2007-GAL-DOM2]KYF42092.1 Toxoplasma gondii family C protein [Toxoplasma gondii ARI]PIL98164.1 Toxoplasma gondii family C protein [Toxoplasma gondii COUG]EPT31626.1 Toxoplasma gondii family C protein [Toxoplasma gondii ME49]|eukprot:XP_002371764.2 Toxoplasma gondii family C protein [Toxoplasma gondii ME49]
MTRDEKRMENKVEKICSGLSIGLHLPSRRKVRRGLLSHRGSLILLSSVALCLMVLAPFVSFEFSTPRMCTALADSVPGLEADNDGSDAYSWTDTEDGTTVEESDDATEEDGTTVEETDGATEGEDGTTVEETDGATEGEDGTTAEETDGATEAEDGTTSEGGGAGTETEDGTTSEGGGAGTETEGGTTFEGGGAGTAAEEGTVYEGGGAGIEAEEGTVYEGGAGAVEVYGGSAEVIYATNDKQIEQNAVEPVQERSRKTRVSRRVSKIQHSERDRPIVASGL